MGSKWRRTCGQKNQVGSRVVWALSQGLTQSFLSYCPACMILVVTKARCREVVSRPHTSSSQQHLPLDRDHKNGASRLSWDPGKDLEHVQIYDPLLIIYVHLEILFELSGPLLNSCCRRELMRLKSFFLMAPCLEKISTRRAIEISQWVGLACC